MTKKYLAHFSKNLSPDIEQYATDEVFKNSRYIFTKRIKKQQWGYCTHCHKTFMTTGLKHNTETNCPKCKSKCKVKASGIRRKTLIDEVYFVYYEKSIIDSNTIIARGINAVRDYSGDYHNVKTLYIERARYIFQIGKTGVMLARYGYYSMAKTIHICGSFVECKSVFSLFSQYYNRSIYIGYSVESIKKAVKDTPFRFSTWESYYDNAAMLKFFSLYAQYPCIEYLTKLGFENFVEAKLNGGNTYSAINWRATSLLKVLRLSKTEFAGIKASNIKVDPLFLRLVQISKKDGSNLTLDELKEIHGTGFDFNDLKKVLKDTTLRQVRNYVNRQYEKANKIEQNTNYCGARVPISHTKRAILLTYKDYLIDCKTLEMNLQDVRVLSPKDVFKAHQKTTKLIKSEGNNLMDRKIEKRLPLLTEQYYFEGNGLLIRPAISTGELIAEGKALVICVGSYDQGYMKRYSEGKTDLLLIRKVDAPDKPFYTVEVRNGLVIQCQGKNHSSKTKEVTEFMEAFKAEKLSKKTKTKIRIPA